MKPYWQADGVTLYHGDCLEVLPTLEAGSVDAVITDPPYGIAYASSWTTRMDGSPRINQASFGDDDFDARWITPTYCICRENAPCYVFTRWDVCHKWKAALEDAGFYVTQRLVWDKKHWKMGDLRYYGSQIEDVLFCRKGTPKMRYKKRRGNLWSYSASWLPEGQYDHPTQKPEALMRDFITDATQPGVVILDPFMGSGTTGVACVKTGRRFIGIEIDEGYCEIARQRIEEAMLQPRML